MFLLDLAKSVALSVGLGIRVGRGRAVGGPLEPVLESPRAG